MTANGVTALSFGRALRLRDILYYIHCRAMISRWKFSRLVAMIMKRLRKKTEVKRLWWCDYGRVVPKP